MAWVVAIDAMGDDVDGMGDCHRWYWVMPLMAWGDAIDGIGRCHRWYWVMPSMPWVMPSMASSMAINGVPRRLESSQAQAPASSSWLSTARAKSSMEPLARLAPDPTTAQHNNLRPARAGRRA